LPLHVTYLAENTGLIGEGEGEGWDGAVGIGAIRGCGLSEIWLFIICPRAAVRALVHLLKDKMSQMVKINLIQPSSTYISLFRNYS
jgi:hypothetical protein